ncbi:MAG: alanyl-tRNA editing protein [Rhodospirillales bacterium]|nr:alanyl-tRNA editing protein [Rhodospirillales bacterium]
MATLEQFREDAYLKVCEAAVVGVNDRGGIVLDQTVFYPLGGGQPGDSGVLRRADGSEIKIALTVYDKDTGEIVHVPEEGEPRPAEGERVTAQIDWDRRHKMMRMHTAMHLLCSLVPCPVTGGQVGDEKSRLDFDMGDYQADKQALTDALNALVTADHPVGASWISDEDLDAQPDLVRTMSVQPPRGSGRVRLIDVGNGAVDLQPCGGTHVARTGEIGRVRIGKIENKGKHNRRVNILLDE